MLLTKLKVVVGAVMVVAALGASSLVYRASGQSAPSTEGRGKSRNELEALCRENELLKLNLEVVLEKVRAQEAELRTLKAQAGQPRAVAFSPDGRRLYTSEINEAILAWDAATGKLMTRADQSGPNKDELRRTVDALEKAVKELREQLKKQEDRPGGK